MGMPTQNRFNNDLGLFGWLGGGRYGFERYAYALHRLTGLGILAYLLMHIFVTGARLGGPVQWDEMIEYLSGPIFKIGEFLVFLAFVYHAMNGIRLALVELGCMIGKPGLPLYPYRHSVLRQRPLLMAVMILTAVFMIVGGIDFCFVMR
jgi:succinate dehydrogenase / fumarate reductase, cytochrome b subunit